MTLHLRVGFMPLIDCALLVLARDEGFAEAQGLALELVREVSWSNLRDKLNIGLFDAAHMLGPAAVAATLGIGGVEAPMAAAMALNLDGSAITLSLRRFEEIARLAQGDPADPAVSAAALAVLVRRRRESGLPPLSFAAVFAFSSHSYLLGRWLALGGLRLGEDIRFEVVPPPQTVEALASGRVDGFCAGAPWNAAAVAAEAGAMMLCGTDLQRDCPDKILAWRAGDIERRSTAVLRLNAALLAASDFACDPANLPRVAQLLAAPDRLGLPAELLEPVLRFDLLQGAGRPPRHVERFIRFDRAALRTDPAQADWIIDGMAAAGQLVPTEANRARARRIYAMPLF
jgi:NitT/TauT family transport system ATP-binding protein